jgi:hypothetical protein
MKIVEKAWKRKCWKWKRKKKLLKSCERIRSPKVEKWKNWLLQKDCEKKIFEKLEKRMVCDCMIVDICGNEMLSSIALKNGSLCWKLCEKFVLNSKFLTHFPKTSTLP